MLLGLVCIAGSVLPLPSATATTTPAAAATRASYTTLTATQFQNRLLARTNARRERIGCRDLRLNSALVLAARRHTTRMADAHTLSHQLPGEPGLGVRATRAGYLNWRMLAENLAAGQSTPSQVFRDWVNSAPHRANLDNCRLHDVGIGVVITNGKPWVTEDFGRR
jgi:uncharacterized protein YkwD